MHVNIQEITKEEASLFIEKYHYSRKTPTGKNFFFGWYVNDTKTTVTKNIFGEYLYAVADYGIGVNPYQSESLSKLTGIDIKKNELVELKRLCRIEPKNEHLQLTMFLSKCHKELKKKGFLYVVSFSDPTFGHTGGIYKAANFTHLGKTNPENHSIDEAGNIRHRRFYYRYARRKNIDVKKAREELGLVLTKTQQKDRWFLRI